MFTTITSEKPNIVSIFLKKKKSSWSLQNFSKNNLFTHTNSTTCSLTHSTICSISSSSHEEDNQTLPPTYDDKSHPWAFQFPKSMLNRTIQPREEEGGEDLPNYECTIERMASAYVKCEFIEPNIRSKKRIWRFLHLKICGTLLLAYKNKQGDPIWSYSMQGAKVTVATDYLKHRHVIRLEILNGPQFLIKTHTEWEKLEWIDCLESSINISSDLDYRDMPQFITLRVRHRRQLNHRSPDESLV